MFNLCLSVFNIIFGHLRIQYSVPSVTQECDDYSLPLLTLLFLPQITSISYLPLLFSIQFCESLWVFWATENTQGTEYCIDLSLSSWVPVFLLLFISISLLPLLFFMQLCEPLWVSLAVGNCFTINLDVLSSVLYRWRSLEATVKIRLKIRSRRLKSKS